MAGPRDITGSVAEDVVFGNFGEDFSNAQTAGQVSDNDLDVGDGDEGGDPFDDQGDEYNPDASGDDSSDFRSEGDDDERGDNVVDLDNRRELDDMRVSHTQPRKRPVSKQAEVKADRHGNLVDKNGKIVARAGPQARLYQNMRRAQRENANNATQLQDTQSRLMRAVEIGREMHQELTQLRGSAAKMKEFGFEAADQLNAMQLYADLRTNPADTIKKLLTRAAAQGINVATFGGNTGTDPKALLDVVRAEIGKAVNPLKERSDAEAARERQQQQQQEGLRQVREEVNGFFGRNPEARRYIRTFQRVMDNPRYANLSLGEIYQRILAAEQTNRQEQPSNRRRTPPVGRSLPRGRRTAPDGRNGQDETLAPLDASWDTVINGVLNDHGMRKAV